MLKPRPLFLLAYLLLWPALLLLATYQSHDATVFGRWSRRMFAAVAALGGLVLIAGALLVWFAVRKNVAESRCAPIVNSLRRRSWIFTALLGFPVVVWILAICVVVMMEPSYALSLRLTWSLISLALAIAAFDLALLLTGREDSQRRSILLRATAVGLSVTAALGIVEVAGRILDLEPQHQLGINPPNLDVRWETREFDIRVTTNSQGLREPADVPLKREGVYRVMVVGDSMTFGQGVNDNETYPRIAADILRNRFGRDDVEIINVSRRGAGPGEYLQYVRHFGRLFQPDLIVIAYYAGNDTPVRQPYVPRTPRQLDRLKRDILQSPRPHFLMRSVACRLIYRRALLRLVNWRRRRRAIDGPGAPDPIFGTPNVLGDVIPPQKLPDDARKRFRTLKKAGWIDAGLNGEVGPGVIEAAVRRPHAIVDMMYLREETRDAMANEWKLTGTVLRETVREAETLGANVWFLILPHPYQIDPRAVNVLKDLRYTVNPAMIGHRKQNDLVCEFCETRNLTFIDPFDEFRRRTQSGERLFYPIDAHCTPAGHRLLAGLLAERLHQHLTESHQD